MQAPRSPVARWATLARPADRTLAASRSRRDLTKLKRAVSFGRRLGIAGTVTGTWPRCFGMFTIPRRPHTIASIARVMLVGWMLALGVGWVNACLVQQPAAAAIAAAHHGPAIPADHAAGDTDASLLACQGFCNTATSALTKSPVQDLPGADLAPVAWLAAWPAWHAGTAPGPLRPSTAPPAPSGPPAAIAFLRLTL